jgi:L-asparagine transporter-like permease
MVYQLLDPEKAKKRSWLLSWNWFAIEATFLDYEKDAEIIKKANKFALQFCCAVSGLIIIDGILVMKFNFVDLKEILLIGTMSVVFLIRYFYIFFKKMQSRKL